MSSRFACSSKPENVETTAVRNLLAEKLGLDPDSLGPSFIESVTRRGLRQAGHTDLDRFTRDAAAGGSAWQALVEHAVVSETWFFRDGAPFDHVVNVVRARTQSGAAPVRILSCPCSTGEEPYSVALALTEAGVPPSAFSIDAADVSTATLEVAKTGMYRTRSFRGGEFDRDTYFEHDRGAREWRLKPTYRQMVRFHPENLLSFEGLDDAAPYDVILCRNLLIYLHADARDRVMATLRRLLVDDGVLIVGHAEPAVAREHGFKTDGPLGAFAFTPSVTRAHTHPRTHVPRASGSRQQSGHRRVAPQPPGRPSGGMTPGIAPPVEAGSGAGDVLDAIRLKGDKGDLDQAVLACTDYVKHVPDSADGHFLLGVLQGAMGHPHAAETALRRAVYLRPDHPDALVHLALAHEARGDAAGAARLRARGARTRRVKENQS